MASVLSDGSRPSERLARAQAHFRRAMPWMIARGTGAPATLKFWSERAVWLPYHASSGTCTVPSESCSVLMASFSIVKTCRAPRGFLGGVLPLVGQHPRPLAARTAALLSPDFFLRLLPGAGRAALPRLQLVA